MKRPVKILLIIVAIALLFVFTPQLILWSPDFLFSEKLEHKNFTVLSDEPIAEQTKSTLDSIVFRLASTGFYNGDPVKIIFCYGDGKSIFIDKISMAPPGAGFHHFSGNIFLFPERIKQFRRENSKVTGEEVQLIQNSYQEFKLTDIVVHEVLHKLHADTMGIWDFRRRLPPPHWKAEGFAEFYAHRPDRHDASEQDFLQRAALYVKYKDKFPLFYMRSQLLYEYLAVYKHLSFSEIMSESMNEQDAYDELLQMIERSEQTFTDSLPGEQ